MLICLGGVPHPMSRGGYLIPRLGGTPFQVWGGTPSQVEGVGDTPYQVWGVPNPRSGGTPCQVQGGTPSQVWGYPISGLGVPHLRSRGYPGYPPSSRHGWGTPQTWDGVPPQPDLGWFTPLPRPEMGYPPPHRGVDWHTKWKYYLPPSFGCGR